MKHRMVNRFSAQLWILLVTLVLTGSLATAVEAQPGFTKAFSPSTIGLGSVSALRFDITTGPGVTDLAFSDTLPAGVAMASPANALSTCGGTLSAPDSGSTITFSDGLLAPGASCTITVDVTSSTVGVHMNVSGDLTSSAGNSGTATADLTVATDRPGFSKSFSPSSVALGSRSTLTFTIDNSANPSAAFLLTFTDNLPSGVEVAGPSNASTTCTGGTITTAPGSTTIAFSNGSISATASCTVSVDVIATGVGSLGNSAGELTSVATFFAVSSGKANAILTVTADPLALAKAFIDDPVAAGSTVTLEFTIINFDRLEAASNITFTDDLDATLSGLVAVGLPLSDPCGSGSSLTGTSLLTLSGGNLAPGGSCNFSVTLQVPAAAASGAYPNTTSSISGDVGGSPVVSGSATETLYIAPVPVLTKTFLDNPAAAGGTVDLEFTITNSSSTSGATSIAFIDELTTFLPFPVSVVLPATPCGAGSSLSLVSLGLERQGLSLTSGNLPASGSCTFQVTITLPSGLAVGTYVNTTGDITATVDAATVTGNPATDSFDVVAAPRLLKEFTDDPVDPGATVTLEFTLTNDPDSPSDATDITFTDNLDAALSGLIALGLPVNDVCGTGSLLSGTSTLTLTGGTLAPGASCIFSVTLQVPITATIGSYTNTTSAVSATVSSLTVASLAATDDLLIGGLTFSKAFTDDPVVPGATATLEFTIANASTLDATGMFFTDNLSTALSGLVAVAPLPATPCGAGSAISGTSFLILVGANLTAGTSCTFSVTVQVPGGAASGSYLNRTSNLTATVGGSVVVVAPAIDILIVDDELLQLSKTFSDDPVAPGGTVTLEFTLTNLDGAQAASGLTFTDDLDAALAGLVAVGLPANNVCGAGSQLSGTSLLTLTGGNLAAGASCTFSATLQVPASVALGTSAVNTTSPVNGTIGGLAVTGIPASDTLLINFLSFSKAFAGPATATGSVILTFTIANLSSSSAVSSLAFSDDLDAVISGLVATGLPQNDVCGAGSQLSGTSLITLTGGSLAASGTCLFNVTLQVPGTATSGAFNNTTSDLFVSGLPAAVPATASLIIEPPPTFAKSFAPDAIGVGGTSTLTFALDNTASALPASSLDFTDTLPAGVTVATPPSAATTCSGTLTAVAGSGTITLSGGSVAAGASCTVQVDVTSSTVGVHVNTTGNLTSSSGSSGTASDSLTIDPQPGFSKSFAPATIAGSGISALTFTIDNTGSVNAATGLDFTDSLPAAVTVATTPNAATTCTGGTLTATAGAGVISYTGGSVAAGATCTLQVDVTSSTVGSHLNTTGDLTSSLGNSGTASDTLVVTPPPLFSKRFAPNAIASSGVSTLTLTIDNSTGALPATSLDFTDNLPAAVTVATPTNAATTCTGGTLTAAAASSVISYTGGSVGAGATCTLQVDVTSSAVGSHLNTTGDLTSSLGNSGTASDTLVVDPPPLFSKRFAPNIIASGGVSTLTFTLDNSASTLPATSLDFTDNLPPAVTVATPTNAATTCTGGTLTAAATSSVISYTGGSVGAGATCTLQVDVTSATVGSHLNTTGDLTSSLGNSGTASATLNIDAMPLFSKSFVPSTIASGGISTLTFTIDNSANLSAATNLDFTDNLPTGGTVATPANAATTCTGGTLTAAPGTATIAYAGGTVGAGTTCTLQVDVTSATVGSHLNTTGDLTSSLGNSGTASATLNVDGMPLFSKNFVPSTIASGGISTLTFTIDNSANLLAATSLDFTDNLPTGGTVATPANAATTCTGGTLTAAPGTAVIAYSGGTVGAVGAGTTCTLQVDVTSSAPGTHINTTGDLTSSLGNSGTASASLTVAPPAVFSKDFAPRTITVGGVTTVIFTIDNSASPLDALNLSFVDNLPASMVVADPANASTTCNGGTLTAAAGAAVVSYTGGSVTAGAICTVVVDVTVTDPATVTNTTEVLTSSLGTSGTASAVLIAQPFDIDIPTLQEWALILLSVLLAFFGFRRLRVR